MLLTCWFLFFVSEVGAQQTRVVVGMLIPRGLPIDNLVGFNASAGAMMTALNKAMELDLYDPSWYNITFKWYYDQCDEALSAGYAARLIHDDKASIIFGPVCSESTFVVGAMGRFYNVPVFLWGPAAPIAYSPRANYPTSLPFAGSVRGTFLSMSYVLSQYNWTKIAFVYTTLNDVNQGLSVCKYFAESFEAQSDASANITEAYIRHAINTSVSGFQTILNSINNRARVVVSCLETQKEKRNYMLAAMANKMVDANYVHLFVQLTSIGFGEPAFWVGKDGQDDAIKEASKSVLILDKYLNTTELSENVMEDIYKNIYNWPFYCKDCPKNGTASSLAVYLADAFLTYLTFLNRTYNVYGPEQLTNTTAVLEYISGVQYINSVLGNTFSITGGVRIAKYYLMGLDTRGEPTVFGMLENNYKASYANASNTIWANRGGFAPLDTPICGYNNEKCPPSALVYTGLVMRATDHPNLNKFLGVSVVGNISYIVWECCTRGNILETIKVHSYRMDSYIMSAMIRNIVEGLHYIHNSKFVQHGALSAYKCVVGDRFEVKIQLYGLTGLKAKAVRKLDDESALYVAPEHLHGQQNEIGSQAGDVYSLAIICSVILNMKPAYDCGEKDSEIAEIVRSIARGKYPPVRPTLDIDPSIEVNPDLISLVKKMWHEHPADRPNINEIRELLLKSIITTRSTNLMDYMFALMENNAAELEKDVQSRTLELLTEQKKADVLLYRMMPREAADKLKLGQTVTPEVYESTTVFFSDIVSFTVLASKSTPLQIINFLNDVYTLADSVIDKYDVYKVETIGDGMHVVSGVPKRNGHTHVKAISDMSIDFQRSVKMLRMSHLPDQQIQMRVGVHSGPAVAGIVGVTSPRYIVFGDTVNVAAKMEASGKAGRIHISATTKALLLSHYPRAYTIFDRGETLVKGIGAMHSHWLVPPEEVNNFQQ
ncbi:Guanylate cyclase [Aphelenchoides bicaudatus]|nr:Guanylate cyclase [Aphelenchoides bicaudatus]